MNHTTTTASAAAAFELRYASLHHEGRALGFPCSASGQVQLSALSERARRMYQHACSSVGRDYAYPEVLPIVLH